EPLARVLDALAVAARGLQLRDLLLREVRAVRAYLLEELERLLAARPLLEHLRRRLDEITLHAGPGLGVVVRLGEHVVQHGPEFVDQRLELVVVQALAVEVGDERGERRALRDTAHAADGERGRMVVFALAREEVQVET